MRAADHLKMPERIDNIIELTLSPREEKLYKQINSILAFATLAIYLLVSFLTMAWHITWIIWIIYAILSEIAKLIVMLATGKDIENEK